MASLSLDAILNFLIPIAVWIFLAWILYVPFKEPINALVRKIKEWKDGREEEEPWELNTIKSIEYE